MAYSSVTVGGSFDGAMIVDMPAKGARSMYTWFNTTEGPYQAAIAHSNSAGDTEYYINNKNKVAVADNMYGVGCETLTPAAVVWNGKSGWSFHTAKRYMAQGDSGDAKVNLHIEAIGPSLPPPDPETTARMTRRAKR